MVIGTDHVALPGWVMYRRGLTLRFSADIALIVMDRPRVAVVADAVTRKAFISNPTACVAVTVPSVAVTWEV